MSSSEFNDDDHYFAPNISSNSSQGRSAAPHETPAFYLGQTTEYGGPGFDAPSSRTDPTLTNSIQWYSSTAPSDGLDSDLDNGVDASVGQRDGGYEADRARGNGLLATGSLAYASAMDYVSDSPQIRQMTAPPQMSSPQGEAHSRGDHASVTWPQPPHRPFSEYDGGISDFQDQQDPMPRGQTQSPGLQWDQYQQYGSDDLSFHPVIPVQQQSRSPTRPQTSSASRPRSHSPHLNQSQPHRSSMSTAPYTRASARDQSGASDTPRVSTESDPAASAFISMPASPASPDGVTQATVQSAHPMTVNPAHVSK